MGEITVLPADFIGQYKIAKSINDTAILQSFIAREWTRTLYRLLGKQLADLLITYNNLTLTTATSGLLVVGQFYTITEYIAGDDFTNIGATSNATGQTFTATGTTPAAWTNSSTVTNRVERYDNIINPFYMESLTTFCGSPYYDSTGIKDLLMIQIYSAYLAESQVRDSQSGAVGQSAENANVQSVAQAYRMGEQKWNTTGLSTWWAIRWYCQRKYPTVYPEYAGVNEHARSAGVLG